MWEDSKERRKILRELRHKVSKAALMLAWSLMVLYLAATSGVAQELTDLGTILGGSQEAVEGFTTFGNDMNESFNAIGVGSANLLTGALSQDSQTYKNVFKIMIGLVLAGVGIMSYYWWVSRTEASFSDHKNTAIILAIFLFAMGWAIYEQTEAGIFLHWLPVIGLAYAYQDDIRESGWAKTGLLIFAGVMVFSVYVFQLAGFDLWGIVRIPWTTLSGWMENWRTKPVAISYL